MLTEKANDIVENLESLIRNGEIECEEDFYESLRYEADNAIIYTSDCWDMAKEADIYNLDSGLWEGSNDINRMIQGIAYAAVEQEVIDLIYSQYGGHHAIQRFLEIGSVVLAG